MVNKKYKFHYIYKTTNLLNNKYYYGMHSTDNLEDGYKGSGKVLKASIKKYGIENFQFEILEYLSDRKALKEREKEVVNQEEIDNKLCMNLQLGGGGGFISAEHAYKFHAAGGRKVRQMFSAIHRQKFKEDPEYKAKCIAKRQATKACRTYKKREYSHSEESKKKISINSSVSQKGERNSQFGTCWVNINGVNKKIKKESLDSYLELGFFKGKVKK